jgi:hypothetical protein
MTQERPTLTAAAALIRADRFHEARPLLVERVDDDPDDAGAWFLLGRCHLGSGQPQAALAALSECVAIDPQHPQGLHALAEVHAALGQPVDALVAAGRLPAWDADLGRLARGTLDRLPPPADMAGLTLPAPADLPVLAVAASRAARLAIESGDWAAAAGGLALCLAARPGDCAAAADLTAAVIRMIPPDGPCPPDVVRALAAAAASLHASLPQAESSVGWWANATALTRFFADRKTPDAAAAHAAAAARWLSLDPEADDARAAVSDTHYAARRIGQAAATLLGKARAEPDATDGRTLAGFLEALAGRLARIAALLPRAAAGDVAALRLAGREMVAAGLDREGAGILALAHRSAPGDAETADTLADVMSRHRLLAEPAALFCAAAVPALPLLRVGTVT